MNTAPSAGSGFESWTRIGSGRLETDQAWIEHFLQKIMNRPRLTPHYVNIEMPVVMDAGLPAGAKVTYMYLKALSWGESEVSFTVPEFKQLFGVPKTTLFRHLSLLATSAVLRFGCSGSRTTGWVQVVFLVANPKRGLPGPKMDSSYSSAGFKEKNIDIDSKPAEEINPPNPIPGLSPEEEVRCSKKRLEPSKNGLEVSRNEQGQSKTGSGRAGEAINRSKETRRVRAIFQLYEQNIGMLTPMIADRLRDALEDYPPGWLAEAIEIAVSYNKRSWAYCEAILERWRTEGKDGGGRKGADEEGAGQALSPVEQRLQELGGYEEV
jgi:DnaD/phage-associated family protein